MAESPDEGTCVPESRDEGQTPLRQTSWEREVGWCCVKRPVAVVGGHDSDGHGVWEGLEERGNSGIFGECPTFQ